MQVTVNVPNYDPKSGMVFKWEDDFQISCNVENGGIKISANKEGLLSLANHLLNLAQESVSAKHHIHLDEYNSLNEGSTELIIQKI